MQAISRWRNLLIFKNTIAQSTSIASTSNTQLAEFHSTRNSYQKWGNKWNSLVHYNPYNRYERSPDSDKQIFAYLYHVDSGVLFKYLCILIFLKDIRAGQQPSKAFIRYKVRLKRADTKKALKDLLFNSGSSRFTFKEELAASDTSCFSDQEDRFDEKDRSKSCHSARRAARAQHRRMKRKLKKEKPYEEMDSSDNVFRTSFRHRGSTWSYWSSREFFHESSTTGFEWKEHPKRSYRKQQESDIESETDSDDENRAEDMYSERKLLGLPTRGPLKIEDIKKAFHLSALKWHPDKHQGPSQGMAEEKFKLCADAYKSLCNSLSTA